jgi:hypothetical protein
LLPSQLLTVEVLRRPIEFTQHVPIAKVQERAAQRGVVAGPEKAEPIAAADPHEFELIDVQVVGCSVEACLLGVVEP